MTENIERIKAYLENGEYDLGIRETEFLLTKNPRERAVIDLQIDLYIMKYRSLLDEKNPGNSHLLLLEKGVVGDFGTGPEELTDKILPPAEETPAPVFQEITGEEKIPDALPAENLPADETLFSLPEETRVLPEEPLLFPLPEQQITPVSFVTQPNLADEKKEEESGGQKAQITPADLPGGTTVQAAGETDDEFYNPIFELREMFGMTAESAKPPVKPPVIERKVEKTEPGQEPKKSRIVIPDTIMCLTCGKINKFTTLTCIKCGADLTYAKKNLIGKDALKRLAGRTSVVGVPETEQKSFFGVLGVISVGLANFIWPEVFAPLAVLSGGIAIAQGKRKMGQIPLGIGILLLVLRLLGVATMSKWLIK